MFKITKKLKKSASLLLGMWVIAGCSSMAPNVVFPDEKVTVFKNDPELKEKTDGRFGDPTSSAPTPEGVIVEKGYPVQSNGERAQYEKERETISEADSEGSIFRSSRHVNLFTDERARRIGDLLTVEILERIDSRQNDNTEVSKEDSFGFNFPEIRGFFGLKGASGTVSSTKEFAGSGSTRANNQVQGTVAVVVTEVLPSGNMRVKGERQIGTNREVKTIKFYGIVNPRSVRAGNRVFSSDVAEARIEYRGEGAVDSAQAMGWLARFFLSVAPF